MNTADSNGNAGNMREPGWGMCGAYGCPLLGTVRRADRWTCYAHFDCDAGRNDEVTNVIRRHRAVWTSTLLIRAWHGTDEWPKVYRSICLRLRDAEHADLLPGTSDCPPHKKSGKPIMQQWLGRLERFLLDAVERELRAARQPAQAVISAARIPADSRQSVVQMRTVLADVTQRMTTRSRTHRPATDDVALPPRVPSPHIYGDDESAAYGPAREPERMREPGCDDEALPQEAP